MNDQLTDLRTSKGKKLLHNYLLLVTSGEAKEKGLVRVSILNAIFRLWKICRNGGTFSIDETRKIAIPKYGFREGTKLWMESIVLPQYSNNIQSFVYLGAMILLIFVGLRFANIIDEKVALIGIVIESTMLFVLSMMLFYTPDDEHGSKTELHLESTEKLLNEPTRELISEMTTSLLRWSQKQEKVNDQRIQDAVDLELLELIRTRFSNELKMKSEVHSSVMPN